MRCAQIAIFAAALIGYASAGAIPLNDDLSTQRGGGGGSERFDMEERMPVMNDFIKAVNHQNGVVNSLLKSQTGSGTKDDPIIIRMDGHWLGEENTVLKSQGGSGTKEDPIVIRMDGRQEEAGMLKNPGASGTKNDPIMIEMEGHWFGEKNTMLKSQTGSGTKDDPIVVRMERGRVEKDNAQQ